MNHLELVRMLISAQMLTTAFLAILLWALHVQLHRQEFNRWWTSAWVLTALFFSVGRLAIAVPPAWVVTKGALILLATLFGLLVAPTLVFGAVSLESPGRITRRAAFGWCASAGALGALSFGLSLHWSAEPLIAFAIRNIVRTLVLALALFYCAGVFFRRVRIERSWAGLLTGISCFLYGLNQCVYTAAEIAQVYGGPAFSPQGDGRSALLWSARFLYADVVFTCGIALGMVLLLVEEYQSAQRALVQTARSRQDFFNLSPMPMAITRESDGVFLFVNDAFTTMTGYSREEALGRNSVELGMITAAARAAAVALFGRSDGRTSEVLARMKDGRVLTLMLSASRIQIEGIRCFVATALDLSRQRAVEDALRESEAQARIAEHAVRRASRQKDEFLALLSHELRNPLTPILTSARLLEYRVDPELRGDVEVIVRQVKHVARLVDDLVDVSRVARGAVRLAKTRLEPATVVARAVAATTPLLEERGHRLEIDVPEQGLAVEADEVRLTQIFDNLLSNAARYTPPGGTVSVSGHREGDMIVLRVCDTGRGIEASLLPDIFDIFVQAPRGVDRAEGGLGVGLSLVRALTELHGGTVTVRSDGPDLGSEFTVRLPAAVPTADRAIASSESSGSEQNSNGSGRRVLIVEDHLEVAQGLTRLMRLLGYDVRAESNPLEAVAAAKAFHPEVALLDIGLPGMDGYALARELRERLGDRTPVLIALSGYSQPRDQRHSQEAGFAAHLTKPVDADDLEKAIEKYAPARHCSDVPWHGGKQAWTAM